jgi:hypothetical protein
MALGSWCGGKAHGCVASPVAATDWADRYPAIVQAASRIKTQSFLDGEVVVCWDDGVSDFKALQISVQLPL